MKRLILSILAAAALAACKPEVYTGPLDSPVGSWDGVKTEYYFNGEFVGEAEGCEYSAISFYADSLCCIEGVKGAFPYIYDHTSGDLMIDNTCWKVQTLTGAELVMEYIETIYPEEAAPASEDPDEQPTEPVEPEVPAEPEEPVEPEQPEIKPDKNGLILPLEYKGVSINSDKNGYYYEDGSNKIYCAFFAAKDEAGTVIKDESGAVIIDFWYDHHIDHFIPLVVEVKK